MKAIRGTLTLELHLGPDGVTVLSSYVGEAGEVLVHYPPVTLPTGSTFNVGPVWGVFKLGFGPTAALQFFVDPLTAELKQGE